MRGVERERVGRKRRDGKRATYLRMLEMWKLETGCTLGDGGTGLPLSGMAFHDLAL